METQSMVVGLPDDPEEDNVILFVEVPDQEEAGRNEFQLEEAVANFKDEGYVWHDVYPDSDKEVEASVRVDIKRGDGRLYEDQKFYNGVAFKDVVLDYALRAGKNISQNRYDKTKLEFKCIGAGCSWRIYCAITREPSLWRVRVFHKVHTCVPNGQCDMIKVPVIARLFVDKIREEPEYYMPIKIKEIIKERWKITVSRHQCQAGRKKACGWIAIEYAEQFSRLRDYGAELELTNEGFTVEIDTIKNTAGDDVFNRFYVCFDVLRRTWKDTCSPLIGVDGSFLKSTTKGQLLVALGRDADNAIYPVAWSVVKVENFDNWLWFVKKIKADLGLGDGEGYILVSDRLKGLIKAAQLELPNIEHRKCVRHIYGNIKAIHDKKKRMKKLIWNLAWSYNEAEYRDNLERLREYDLGVYNYVMKTNPKTWCRVFYKIGNYCEDVENNSVESFNSSIVKAREKPFMPMLETIKRLAMAQIAERYAKSHDHKGICTPYVAKFLAAEHKKASLCSVISITNVIYESFLHGEPFRVNMEKRTCSCRKWDICGIPCVHAYGVILKKTLDPDQCVCHWFRTTMWRRNYTDGLVPIRAIRFWPTTNAPLVHEVPAEKDDDDDPTEPGKKKETKIDKKRKRGKNESPVKKKPIEKKRIMHCGICGAANHNSRFHKKKSKQAGESSQDILTQMESSTRVHDGSIVWT